MTTRRCFLAGGAGALGLAATARADPAPKAVSWTTKAAMPLRTQEVYAAAHGGEIWVAGGLSPDAGGPKAAGLGITDRVVAYDPGEDAWREAPALPAPRHHAHLVGHQGRLYVVGGFVLGDGACTMTPSVLTLDGAAWREVAPLPVPQAETVCASMGDTISCVTGRRVAGARNAAWSDHADTNAHLAYDATADAWSIRAPAPTARNSASGATVGGSLLVVGGRTVTGGNSPAFEAYDAEADAWTRLPDMPEGRGGLAAALVDGTMVALGGEWFGPDGGGVYGEVLGFEFGERAWSARGRMPTPRHGLGLAVLDGVAYAVGGATSPGGRGTSAACEAAALC